MHTHSGQTRSNTRRLTRPEAICQSHFAQRFRGCPSMKAAENQQLSRITIYNVVHRQFPWFKPKIGLRNFALRHLYALPRIDATESDTAGELLSGSGHLRLTVEPLKC